MRATVPDLLVKLYELPAETTVSGVDIRRAQVPEKHAVVDWVGASFGPRWGSECDVAFARHPVRCHVALADGALVGFAWGWAPRSCSGACTRCARTATRSSAGSAPKAFYERVVPVMEIPGSSPGIYQGLRR